jgi:hypothetical protein
MHGVPEHAAIIALEHLLHRVWRVRFWRYKIVRPNAEIRVSFSALLRILGGGRYVLIRNLHRPEVFAPIGGVFKFYGGARGNLDSLLFRPEDVGPLHDMRNDLRGFLPRKNLGKIIAWFDRHEEREGPTECLGRELKEELREIGLNLPVPSHFEVRKVRSVEEGPEKVPGRGYMQFRIFEVYDVEATTAECLQFFETLTRLSEKHNDLILADSSDVVSGRCNDGRVIGHHTAYLCGKKRLRPDVAPFVGSGP